MNGGKNMMRMEMRHCKDSEGFEQGVSVKN